MLGRIIKKVALMTDTAASASKSGVAAVWITLLPSKAAGQ